MTVTLSIGFQKARHSCTLPVRGHGGGGSLCQLHVIWREEEVVCFSVCPAADREHLRILRWRTGVLWGVA